MRRAAPTLLCFWLHQLSLCLWLGGIFALGMVAAPAVFGAAKAQGATDNTSPLYRFAGEALGEVFRRFNFVALGAGILAVVTGLAYAAWAGVCPVRARVRAALTLTATTLVAACAFGLTPPMLAARAAGDWAAFNHLHEYYTLAFKAQTVLLLGVLALTAAARLMPAAAPRLAEAAPGALPSSEPAG